METRYLVAAVGTVGALALVLALAAPAAVPVPDGGAWLLAGVGAGYLASAAVAWAIDASYPVSFPLTVVPAALAGLAAVATYPGGALGSVLGPGQSGVGPAVLVVVGMALSFPLGAARQPRQQWAVLGLLGLAAVPVVAVGLAALTPGPPEDRDLLVLVGMVAVMVAVVPAVPTYALGRSVRSRPADPSPYPTLIATALPFGLAVAGLLARPHFARETIYGPWLAVVPVVALLTLAQLAVRSYRHSR